MSDQSPRDDLRILSAICDKEVVESTHGRWGFTNRTDLVTFADGTSAVVQQFRKRASAAYRLDVMRHLQPLVIAAGITIPIVRSFNLDAEAPWAIYERLPGTPVPAAGDASLSGNRFPEVAHQMGRLQKQLAEIPIESLHLNDAWGQIDRLADLARHWTHDAHGLNEANRIALRRSIDRLPLLFAGRKAVFAHGDFAPVNVLVTEATITGLVDFEFARLADPLFDIAWWKWVVSFHHSDAFDKAWPSFLEGAGLDPNEPLLNDRLEALANLRLLEWISEPEGSTAEIRELLTESLTARLG